MNAMDERVQYRAAGASGPTGTAPWPDAATRSPLMMSERVCMDALGEEDRRAMEQYGITPRHKTVYTYKAHVYDRFADALAYARIDSVRIVG